MDHSGYAVINRTIVAVLAILAMAVSLLQAVLSSNGAVLYFHFNPYASISLVALLINLGLLIYIVSKPARTEERLWLSIYLAAITLFAASELLQRLSVHAGAALYWGDISGSSSFISAALYLFVLSYTSQSERRYIGLAVLLFMGSILLYYSLSYVGFPFEAATKAHLFPWGYYAANRAGKLVAVAELIWVGGLTLASVARLVRFRMKSRNPILRKQSMIFIIATGAPLVLAICTDTALPTLGLTSLPPLGMPILTLAAAVLTFGAVRYKVLTVSPTLFSTTILSIMQEAVVVTDDQYDINYVNPKAEALLGVPAESSAKHAFLPHLDEVSAKRFSQIFTVDSAAKNTVELDQINIIGHSHNTPVHVTASRLKLSDISMWVFALSDITKELEVRSVVEHEVQVRTRQLHEARAYLVSSINSLEQGFILVDTDGTIELLNQKAGRLFHTSDDAAMRQPAAKILADSSWNIDLGQAIARALDQRTVHHLAAAVTNGSFYEVYVTPVVADAQLLGATVIVQDVTEQKILERSKDEFFSIASHELRTPLTAIRGNMSMAKEYYSKQLKDGGLRGLVDDSYTASVRLIDIVSDFLDSSRLEQGKMIFNFEAVTLAPLVTSVVNDLKNLSEEQGNHMTVKDLAHLPPVEADQARLRQVIYNLLSNANKYTEKGSITITATAKNRFVVLRVADTGKGISPEAQKLLFRKFQQAGDPLTRDNTKGTGLGLYIARLLAHEMHGKVELEHSEAGKGSTFLLVLPVAGTSKHKTHRRDRKATRAAERSATL